MARLFKISFLFCILSLSSSAQERSVYGRVVDSTMHAGINGLIIQNKTTGQLVNSNQSGDFYIRAQSGDSIFVADLGYDRVGVVFDGKNKYPVIATKTQPKMLREVVITEKRAEELQAEIEDFLNNPNHSGAIRQEILGNVINTNTTMPGLGISIDALYDLWSKRGIETRKVADLKYADVKEFYVDLKYNRKMVAQVTKLEDEEIDDYMKFCKPQDDFILRASDYDLTNNMLSCLKEFRTSKIFRRTR